MSRLSLRPRSRPRSHRRHGNDRERGSVTAEFAVVLPAAVLLLTAGLSAVNAVTTRIQCLDAAREAALAGARGESATAAANRRAPPGATVTAAAAGDTFHAEVTASVPLLGDLLPPITVSGDAVAAMEPEDTTW
ncbi:TadE family type IV pilus minor pilin [Phytomonospora sp. NPDC050363]|uniref:TadE family type IV pilus minor pilin n=1 Tax=Phytomonospora sp. NPDC050363 TaxID=3155642 RepID=UPI0033FA86FF